MTETDIREGGLPFRRSRAVLVLAGLGLAALLLALLAYRLTGPPLVRNAPRQAPAQSQVQPQVQPQVQSQAQTPGTEPSHDAARPAPAAPDENPGMIAAGMDETAQAALIAAMQVLREHPNDVDALLALADLFMAQDRDDNAQSFVRRALVAAPSDARPAYYQGVLQARQGSYEEAAASLERSLALLDAPATRYSLGVIYIYHLQARDKGLSHLKAALQDPAVPPELRERIQAELGGE